MTRPCSSNARIHCAVVDDIPADGSDRVSPALPHAQPVIGARTLPTTVRQAVFPDEGRTSAIEIEVELRRPSAAGAISDRADFAGATNAQERVTEAIERCRRAKFVKGRIDGHRGAQATNSSVIIVMTNGIGLPKVAARALLRTPMTTRDKGTRACPF